MLFHATRVDFLIAKGILTDAKTFEHCQKPNAPLDERSTMEYAYASGLVSVQTLKVSETFRVCIRVCTRSINEPQEVC